LSKNCCLDIRGRQCGADDIVLHMQQAVAVGRARKIR